MYSEWPRSQKAVEILPKDCTDLDFVRRLNKPTVLDQEYTSSFDVGRWLTEDVDANGMRVVDYNKFLDDFDPYCEVSIETYDPNNRTQSYGKMTLADFIEKMRSKDGSMIYLKDWHAQKDFAMHLSIYQEKLPYFMNMDWINAESWTSEACNPVDGDYRFIYFGAPGSRTLLHYDVFRSFSWSLNIAGFKHWLFLPPERTDEFFRKYPEETDFTKYPGVVEEFGLIEWIQSPGEMMVVPPGWYHQVLNLTECLSINHNTINVFNVIGICDELEERFLAVLKELDDQRELRDAADFAEVVEMVLNSDYRITKQKLLKLAQLVENDRLEKLQCSPELMDCDPPADIEEKEFWTQGSIHLVSSIFKDDSNCNCVDPGRHLLSPHPCSGFIQKMIALDYFYSRVVIRRMVQNNGEFDFYG